MDMTIENLPALLIGTIRAGTWDTPNADVLRQVARVVGRAQHAGLPYWDLIDVLAVVARADMPVPNTGWTPEMHAINRVIWPYLASSTSLNCTVHKDRGAYSTPSQGLAIAQAIVADEVAKISLTSEEADKAIRAEMERVAALHPEIGLSYGYIGNVSWGPRRDDRAFMVFTRLRDSTGRSISFGSHPHDRLGELAFMVRGRLAAWAAEQEDLMRKGSVARLPMAA